MEYCGHFFSSKDNAQSCWQAGAFDLVDSVELQLQDVAVEDKLFDVVTVSLFSSDTQMAQADAC